jgi:hypothetical protein
MSQAAMVVAAASIYFPARWQGGAEVRRWLESSTAGVLGCFSACIGLLLLAAWIAWTIMEASIPG